MKKAVFIGDINNWMDMRDQLVDMLKNCDTELKFNKFFTGLIMSIRITPEDINRVRKGMGIEELSQAELESLKKIMEEDNE